MKALTPIRVESATTAGRSSALLGRIYVIEGKWWVVGAASRTRLTLKLAESEWHAIRLNLGLTQCELAARLGISQPWLCKIEKGVAEAPDVVATQLREMRPNVSLSGAVAPEEL